MGVFALASCEKYEQSTPYVINDSITATVTGSVYADMNLQNAGNEFAPQGVKIFIQVSLQEYNPNSPAGEFKTYSTTVNADGKYSFSLPSNDNGVNFTIIPDQFMGSQVQADGSTKSVPFATGNVSGFAFSNQTVINNIVY